MEGDLWMRQKKKGDTRRWKENAGVEMRYQEKEGEGRSR